MARSCARLRASCQSTGFCILGCCSWSSDELRRSLCYEGGNLTMSVFPGDWLSVQDYLVSLPVHSQVAQRALAFVFSTNFPLPTLRNVDFVPFFLILWIKWGREGCRRGFASTIGIYQFYLLALSHRFPLATFPPSCLSWPRIFL